MTSIAASKKAIRQQMRLILKSMPPDEKERQSQIIAQKLLRHPVFLAAERVSIYVNTPDEVATAALLHASWNNGKTLFIPKYDQASRNMQMVLLRSVEEYNCLPLTSWNIRQPAMEEHQDDALLTGGLDLIVVPGLAFTSQSGHRLGSGRGYYDRYFEKIFSSSDSRPFLLGLAFHQQILPHLPITHVDVAMDQVITCTE